MKYIFPLAGPYSYVNHALCRYDTPLEFSVFSDIIFNYVQACVRRWLFGYDYNSNVNMLNVGLKYLLNQDDVDNFLMYLDNSFWPLINNSIEENITSDTIVIITVTSEGALMLEVKPDKTALEKTLDRVYVDVEHKLDSGEYIDPILMEIYNASRSTTPQLQD